MKNKDATIKNFLRTAFLPAGETMYIWGGGWNKDGNGAGEDALRIGKNPLWREFFESRTPEYDFKNYFFKHGFGLDCSGYVGWVMQNFFASAHGIIRDGGYVFKAGEQAERFADMGFGTYKAAEDVTDFKAGDIMSSPQHVYIVIGECSDGSVALLHSSPPGVQLCGTYSKSGLRFSRAAYLTKTYMSEHFGAWYNKFGCRIKDTSYLTQYAQFRWNIGDVISDPDGFLTLSADRVLAALYPRSPAALDKSPNL